MHDGAEVLTLKTSAFEYGETSTGGGSCGRITSSYTSTKNLD